MADEITLEHDIDEVIGTEPAEAVVPGAEQTGASIAEPEDEDEDEDSGDAGGGGDEDED